MVMLFSQGSIAFLTLRYTLVYLILHLEFASFRLPSGTKKKRSKHYCSSFNFDLFFRESQDVHLASLEARRHSGEMHPASKRLDEEFFFKGELKRGGDDRLASLWAFHAKLCTWRSPTNGCCVILPFRIFFNHYWYQQHGFSPFYFLLHVHVSFSSL